tara:strand:+ start:897 stop:1100 length:204 start_codon:yes stop_codon:yes gene_type:complete
MEQTNNKFSLFEKYINKDELQKFLGFGNTKMCVFHKEYKIKRVKLGKKIFYLKEDVERLFNESKILQ